MKLYFELEKHQAYKISGDDAKRYLQGRITQDIKSLDSAQSLLLSPQGKIQAKFNIHSLDDGYIIISDPSETFEEDLLQFKVADHVIVEKMGAKVISITDDSSLNKFKSFRYKEENFDIIATEKEIHILESEGFTKGTEDQRIELKIESFKPEYGSDIDKSTSATEIPYKDLISFTKGCYSGQEVVEMSIARGKPNKTLVKLSSDNKITEKDLYLTNKKEKKCGFIQTSFNKSAFAYIKSAHLEQDTFYTKLSALNKISE